MTEPIDFAARAAAKRPPAEEAEVHTRSSTVPPPSNEVYARVGELVLRTAQNGVRRGAQPEDIIREISADHHIRLSLGELRLLLATRRIGE